MFARVRRRGTILWFATLILVFVLAGTHLAVSYALVGEFDPRFALADAGMAALFFVPAAWYIGSLTDERQRHAGQELLLRVLQEPRNIRDTATEALTLLVSAGVGQAGVIAVADEEDEVLRVVAAAGYPEGWVLRASPLHLVGSGQPVVRREEDPPPWVAPLGNTFGKRPWVARIPLVRSDNVIGLVILVARREGVLQDTSVLAAIADQLSAALEHAALYEAAYRRELDLEGQDQRRREFIAAISHEIRTPLTSIQAFAELLLLDRGSMDAGAESLVTSLTLGVGRLNSLVADLIDLGRAGRQAHEVHTTELDVVELLRSADAVLRPAFLLREQSLVLEVPEHPLHAVADQRLLEQVVMSLLSNANRHAPPGGSVVLRARPTGDGHVRLEVEDSGPGIPPEERERIFEPYYRVPRTDGAGVPGSGLGLAVARQLIDQQDGRIWVESAEHGGACFMVEVRASRERVG